MTRLRILNGIVVAGLFVAAVTHADPRPVAGPKRPSATLAMPAGPPMPAAPAPAAAIGAILDSNAARISFQALLTDNLGDPLPGTEVKLSFALYAVGAVFAIETIPVQNYPMANGVVQVQIPVSPDSFDGSGRELGVTISGQSEMSPRIPLTAVPYAFRVNRVASAELDDDIALGDTTTSGSLLIHSGFEVEEAFSLNGATGQLRIYNPVGEGRIVMHGNGQLMATWDENEVLTALYGNDSVNGGASCLLGTPSGTIGLLLDGHEATNGGGHVVLYDVGTADAISLEAGTSTVRIGSPNGDAAPGNLHMYPRTGAPSRIHLDAQVADMRLGLTGDSSGDLRLYSGGGGIDTIHLDGANSLVTLTDGATNTVRLNGDAASGGGGISMWNSAGTATVEIDADENDHAALRLSNSAGTAAISALAQSAQLLVGSSAGGAEGDVHVYSANGAPSAMHLDGDSGDLRLGWGGTSNGRLLAYSALHDAATINLNGATGQVRIGSASGGADGDVHVYSAAGSPSSIRLDGANGDLRLGWPGSSSGSLMAYSSSGGSATVDIDGANGQVSLSDTSIETVRLVANGGGGGGAMQMWNSAGTATVEIDADETDHAALRLHDASGDAAITLTASNGRTTTRILRITGGADIAEPFDVRGDAADVRPGLVVSIDSENPGKLMVSSKAYDRAVAGIISGAGGVNPGMVMGQIGTIADGEHAVALTGRVYVWADATRAPIEVGDLLTTADVAGHAAKVVDYPKAQGAVIGKAMTPLHEGRGLILVLVSLQ